MKAREKLKSRAKPHEKRAKSRFIPPSGSDQSAHAAILSSVKKKELRNIGDLIQVLDKLIRHLPTASFFL